MIQTATRPDIFFTGEIVRQLARELSVWGRRSDRWTVLRNWRQIRPRSSEPILFVSTLENVDDSFVDRVHALRERQKAYLLLCGALACSAVPERVARLRVGDPERIHVTHADDPKEVKKIVRRLFLTMRHSDQTERIFDAWWEDDVLVVLSPRFHRLHAPLKKLVPLKRASREDLDRFEIDEEGAYIYWPSLDVHLGWEQFLQATDEKAYLRARQQSGEFNRRYGAAIRALRERTGLLQTDIKGLTSRQIGRIERGVCRATLSALTKLAQAHRTDLTSYLNELASLMD